MFDLGGGVAVVTGGTGALGGAAARGLAAAGARVAVLSRSAGPDSAVVRDILEAGGEAMAVAADVRSRDDLVRAREEIASRWGGVRMLVNAAGGNIAAATLGPEADLFDMSEAGFREVVDLNLLGTLLPIQVFGAAMAAAGEGAIVNVSSMAAQRPLTQVGGYGAAKAAVESLTRWLAVEMARRYGPGLRVNAVAPGFFLGDQNRRLLLRPDGSPTERAAAIIQHTPAGRFGAPQDLSAAIVFLCSPGAAFVSGAVLPVDGGFGAFSGV